MNQLSSGSVVLDAGGGRTCRFADRRRPGSGVKIIAIDISVEELAHNSDVDQKVVADLVEGLPFPDSSVDMVVSRSLIEHLSATKAFVAHAARVLKPGGLFISVFPSKYAPYALANRALPKTIAQRLIHFLQPGSEGQLGFPAFYDQCSVREMRTVLESSGLTVEHVDLTYYQSDYFDFFAPLYLLSVLYELGAKRFGAQQIAAAALIVARRR